MGAAVAWPKCSLGPHFLVPLVLALNASAATSTPPGQSLAKSPCAADLGDWLYDEKRWAPPGYHVVCVSSKGKGDSERHVEIWVGGHVQAKPQTWSHKLGDGFLSFRRMLQRKASMKKQKRWRLLPWSLHEAAGETVRSQQQLHGVLLVFEGGRWVWPGIREGFARRLDLGLGRTVTMKTLTLDPLAFTVEGFMNSSAAKRVVERVRPRFQRSAIITGREAESAQSVDQARTCSEAWVDPLEDPDLEEVARSTAVLTRVPRKLQEDFRMLEYRPGEHFVSHTDYYEVEDFKDHPEISQELKDGRNWLVTVYGYLSTVKAGGETYFPSTYGGPLPSNLSKCEGPAVSPRRGNALLFYSLHPDSSPNLSSMHGGCKVLKGVKYTVNIWTFNQLKGIKEPDAEDRLPQEEISASSKEDL